MGRTTWTLALGAVGLLAPAGASRAPAGELYKTRFEGTGTAPVGWTPRGGARWDAIGRTGRAIRISTYTTDKRGTRWVGPAVACAGKPALRVTGWWAENIRWSQDHLYCGVVCAVFLDDADKEIARRVVAHLSEQPKPIRYVKEWFVPEGLFWRFFDDTVAVPAGAVRVRPVLAFSSYAESWRDVLLEGDVWVDDLRLLSAGRVAGKAHATPAHKTPVLGVHTPMALNLYQPSDPLQFNIAIPREVVPAKPDWQRLSLRYEVRDIHKLMVEQGTLCIGKTPDPYDDTHTPGQGRAGHLVRAVLPDGVKRHEGQWLAARFCLRDGKRTRACGDAAFAVLRARRVPFDQIADQRIMRGTAGGRYRHIDPADFYFGYKRTPPFGDAKRPSWRQMVGFDGLVHLGWVSGDLWAKSQKTQDGPIDFSAFPDEVAVHGASRRVFRWEDRVPSYRHFVFVQVPRALPDWMRKDEQGRSLCKIVRGGERYPHLNEKPWSTRYARWALDAVKHTNSTYYTITSMEGPGYREYPGLILETAKTIKAWEPRIRLGVCGPGGREGARKLKALGLIEHIDFLCNDVYSTVVEDRAFVREARRHNKDFEYLLTEYMDVVGKGHFGLARNTIQFITAALGGGIAKLTWFAGPSHRIIITQKRHTWGPDLWEPYQAKGDCEFIAATRTAGEGPRVVPEYACAHSIHPLLNLISLYHLNRLLAPATGGQDVRAFHAKCRTYGFSSGGRTLLVSWTRMGVGRLDVTLSTDATSVELTDIAGRRTVLATHRGKAFLTVSADPLFLHFSQRVTSAKAAACPIRIAGLDRPVARGTARPIVVSVDNPFGSATELSVRPCPVDPRWRFRPTHPAGRRTAKGPARHTFHLDVPTDIDEGIYPVFFDVRAAGKRIGRLVKTITVAGSLAVAVDSRVPTRRTSAAVIVTVRNHRSRPSSGTVSLVSRFVSGWEPVRLASRYRVAAGGTGTVVFELGRTPSRAKRHTVVVDLRDDDGTTMHKEEHLFFIGAPKATQPIVCDGDLSDWQLDELAPNPFFFHMRYQKSKLIHLWNDRADCDGTMYVRWDDRYLYFAFDVRKKWFHNDGEHSGVWPFDCMHVSLYPLGMKKGDNVLFAQYRDHVAIDQHGKPIIDRCQGPQPVPRGGYWPTGCKLAIRKRPGKGYVFELAYAQNALKPLTLAAGQRFRLALTFIYSRPGRKGFCGIGWFYGTGNVDGAPDLHGQIELVAE